MCHTSTPILSIIPNYVVFMLSLCCLLVLFSSLPIGSVSLGLRERRFYDLNRRLTDLRKDQNDLATSDEAEPVTVGRDGEVMVNRKLHCHQLPIKVRVLAHSFLTANNFFLDFLHFSRLFLRPVQCTRLLCQIHILFYINIRRTKQRNIKTTL